jgi:hypothetical protein
MAQGIVTLEERVVMVGNDPWRVGAVRIRAVSCCNIEVDHRGISCMIFRERSSLLRREGDRIFFEVT